MIEKLKKRLEARSLDLLGSLEHGLERIMKGWLLIALLACSARVAAAPISLQHAGAQSILPYVVLTVAPVASLLLALRWFTDGHLHPQPTTRLAFAGQWRSISAEEAQAHPLYGTSGIMVSLLVGMLLNVPVRAAEYLSAMPPIPAAAPQWLSTLGLAMTLDAVLFTSLYSIAFVAALRRVPLFPRLLVSIWMCDIAMQLVIGNVVAATPHLPQAVAVALQDLLIGNVKKVLISVTLWLPYLLLSTRVNVTYRQRVPA